MKKYFLIILFIISTGFCQTEANTDTTWKKQLIGSLNFSQVYFDNWAAGGENSIAGQFDINGNIENNTESHKWITSGKLAYGNSKIGDSEAKKTIDEVRLESMISFVSKMPIDYYLALKGETQIAPGYVYTDSNRTQISALFDPGYFTQSAGFIYNPKEDISFRIGAAIKETVTGDYPSPFADDPDTEEIEKNKVEPGLETVIGFSKNISETTQILSTLDMFNNFDGFDATDVKWDTDIVTKVTKYINIKMSLKIFYDKDISKKRQINQAIMLGLSYAII